MAPIKWYSNNNPTKGGGRRGGGGPGGDGQGGAVPVPTEPQHAVTDFKDDCYGHPPPPPPSIQMAKFFSI